MTKQTKANQTNPIYKFQTESERELGVCIAIQKLGKASVKEIEEKIIKMNGKLTEKQISKSAENLRARGLLSIDLTEKDDNGISIKRYLMKRLIVSMPEVAQIKDVVDDPSVIPLKDELERSKGTRKKGMKTFDYYKVRVEFDIEGEIQGFVPDKDGILRHYRKGNDVIFYQYHFRNWFRANLPLINRASSSIGDIRFFNGKVLLNDNLKIQGITPCMLGINERYITNVQSGFNSSNGTAGRGIRKAEIIPNSSKVVTYFCFPREFISPQKIQTAFNIICENGTAFGGNHKLSTGRLINPKIQIVSESLWEEED